MFVTVYVKELEQYMVLKTTSIGAKSKHSFVLNLLSPS